jgi:hypothetical protein
MSLFPVNVDYSARDHKALRLRLQGLIRSVYPDWTDFNKANFGNIIIDSFCYVGDVLNFYQDKQAGDLYWATVQQRANAIRLGRRDSFSLTSAQSATTSVTFSIPSNTAVDIPIPFGTRLRTPGNVPVYFRVTSDSYKISAGSSSVTSVPVEQAIAVGSRNPTTGLLTAGESFTSTGAPNQRYITLQGPAIDDSTTVVVESGPATITATVDIQASDGKYYQVTSFLDDDPVTGLAINQNSRVFVAVNHPTSRLEIVFGNGSSGKIPGGEVGIAYKLGGGAIGNVEASQITVVDVTISDLNGVPQPITVTNPTAATGGVDPMSVLEARVRGPQSLRVRERSVANEDFEIVALGVAGVARAAMLTSNDDSAVSENAGILYVVAKGARLDSGRITAGTPSSTMLADVLTAVTSTYPQTLTFSVSTAAAIFATTNVSTRVYIASGYTPATVAASIRTALNDFFAAQLADGTANPDIDFGAKVKQADGTTISEIIWSDVFNAVRDTTGVRSVDPGSNGLLLNLLRQNIAILPREFPILGTVSIVDADTGTSL